MGREAHHPAVGGGHLAHHPSPAFAGDVMGAAGVRVGAVAGTAAIVTLMNGEHVQPSPHHERRPDRLPPAARGRLKHGPGPDHSVREEVAHRLSHPVDHDRVGGAQPDREGPAHPGQRGEAVRAGKAAVGQGYGSTAQPTTSTRLCQTSPTVNTSQRSSRTLSSARCGVGQPASASAAHEPWREERGRAPGTLHGARHALVTLARGHRRIAQERPHDSTGRQPLGEQHAVTGCASAPCAVAWPGPTTTSIHRTTTGETASGEGITPPRTDCASRSILGGLPSPVIHSAHSDGSGVGVA